MSSSAASMPKWCLHNFLMQRRGVCQKGNCKNGNYEIDSLIQVATACLFVDFVASGDKIHNPDQVSRALATGERTRNGLKIVPAAHECCLIGDGATLAKQG